MIKVDNKSVYILEAFRSGNDTVAIANALKEKEYVIERMLHAALAIERNRVRTDGERNGKH